MAKQQPKPSGTVEAKVDLDGIAVHCEITGEGPPLIMIHGSAPGASSRNTWPLVLAALSQQFQVITTDLIGWGYSGRKTSQPFFDPTLWARQIRLLADRFAVDGEINVLGHSLGGYVALLAAAQDTRIRKVLTTGAMGASYSSNEAMEKSWNFPADLDAAKDLYDHILVALPDQVREDIVGDRISLMARDGYKDYFSNIFPGSPQKYIDQAVLSADEASRIRAEVLLVYGADDIAVPYATAGARLADALPEAHLLRLAGCGHAVMLDAPAKLAMIAKAFFSDRWLR